MRQVRVGIVGGTGYTGAELVRLLSLHAAAELVCITSRQNAGRPVVELFPALRGVTELAFEDPETPSLRECDVVFFATPHGTAMQAAPALLDAGIRVVDGVEVSRDLLGELAGLQSGDDDVSVLDGVETI